MQEPAQRNRGRCDAAITVNPFAAGNGRRSSRRISTLLLAFFLLAPQVYGIQVQGLYEADVPVPNQGNAARVQGIHSALRQVLVKLTGDRHGADVPALLPVLRLAEDYVQQYRYFDVVLPAPDPDAAPIRGLRLSVRFDEESLNRTLRDLGVSIWSRERPATLLWLVMGEGMARNWATMEHQAERLATVEQRARARGIALLYPLHDLEDSTRLQPSDIWGGFGAPVQDASARYRADVVLTGAVESPVEGIWEARWVAYLHGEKTEWSVSGVSAEAVLEEGIDALADMLAARFVHSQPPGQAAQVGITIADIFNADQYSRALRYLESLHAVSAVQVGRVEPGQVSFTLTVHGGEDAIAQAITFGRTLERVSGGRGGLYRLLP
jgi:hypothetical protein